LQDPISEEQSLERQIYEMPAVINEEEKGNEILEVDEEVHSTTKLDKPKEVSVATESNQ